MKGLTFIELLIGIAIAGILVAIAGILVAPIFGDGTSCRNGFLFDAQTGRQLISESGGGLVCGVAQR